MGLPQLPPLAQPPWKYLGKKLESTCRKTLFDYEMVNNVPKVAIALSGGKDSLTLLFLLKAITGRGFPPFELIAIHVAGTFSCGASQDANYLQAICHRLEVPLITTTYEQSRENLECYSCSRMRRKLIFEAARLQNATTVAFGHHLDDNAQTLLLNLLQKAEFAGMLPKVTMIHYGVTIIRPLISIKEKDIIQFAKEYGFAKISCRCPVGQNSQRKKVDQFITDIEEYFPHARQNLAQSALHYGSTKAQLP